MKKLFEFIGRLAFSEPAILFSEPVPTDEPVVFVANHEKNYGPGVMQLYFPRLFRPWVIFNMLEPGVCKAYVQETFFEERLGWPAWLSGFAAKAIEPLLLKAMAYTRPVPVYREDPQRISATFRASLDALQQGENLLVFPENPYDRAYSANIQEFYPGFLYLAKLYRRKTGRGLLFCPVSINPAQESVRVGKPVRFNPDGDYPHEAERVRQHLMQQVSSLYCLPGRIPTRQGSGEINIKVPI